MSIDVRVATPASVPRGLMSGRPEALSLFRRLFRAARGLPTENRVLYVRAKVRREFEAHRDERNHEKIAFLVSLGETQLDQVRAHAEHLTKVFSDPGVHARV